MVWNKHKLGRSMEKVKCIYIFTFQNVSRLMERIVCIHAVYTASIRSLTALTEPARSVVRKEKTVIEVCCIFLFLIYIIFSFWMWISSKKVHPLTLAASLRIFSFMKTEIHIQNETNWNHVSLFRRGQPRSNCVTTRS